MRKSTNLCRSNCRRGCDHHARPFWEAKRLSELSGAEWELLCDRCGMCCAHKFEVEETGEIFSTNLACSLLNLHTCKCSDYANRSQRVPECVNITPMNIRSLYRMLPTTCAYRRRAYGRPLPEWHPLVTGNPRSTERAGMSARNRFLRLET